MKNKLLKSFIAVVIAASSNHPCLAGSTESSNESSAPLEVSGAGMGSQINSAIQASTDLSREAKQVNVATKDGAIVLTGTVPTDDDRQKINSIIEQSGAASVRNEIKVANSGKHKHKTKSSTQTTTP